MLPSRLKSLVKFPEKDHSIPRDRLSPPSSVICVLPLTAVAKAVVPVAKVAAVPVAYGHGHGKNL